MTLPYKGKEGENIIKKMNKELKNVIQSNIKLLITFKSRKLESFFGVKDKTNPKHKHNIVYMGSCPDCKKKYIGETKCRFEKRIIEHNKRDKNSHLLKHSNESKHKRVWLNDFTILGNGFSSNFKRKISESLLIKEHKPELNVQKDSYILKLFN